MVLITEYYDESLIMMRRQFCWELSDIVYLALKVRKRNKQLSSTLIYFFFSFLSGQQTIKESGKWYQTRIESQD